MDSALPYVYTLSLHDALPISVLGGVALEQGLAVRLELVDDLLQVVEQRLALDVVLELVVVAHASRRSEEHTSELQSRRDIVCRLLLEKKKPMTLNMTTHGVNE